MDSSHNALSWKSRSLSRELLREYIHSTSRRIKEFGVKQDIPVVIIAPLSPAYVIVLLSLWNLKIAPHLVDPCAEENYFSSLPPSALVILDKKGACSHKRKAILDDLVSIELVESFMGLKNEDPFLFDPKDVAVNLAGEGGSPHPAAFEELLMEMDTKKTDIQLSPLHQIEGLRLLCQGIAQGRTILV